MIKIVDNKKVEMTADELRMYDSICRSYDAPNRKGEDLFVNLFESDDSGLIVFLIPPSDRFTSLEAFLFIMSLMQQQHLRRLESYVMDGLKQIKETKNKADLALKKAEEKS